MPFVGLIVGAVICSLPYILYSAEFPPPAITAIALTLSSAGLAISQPSDKWWSGIAVGAGILVPIATVIGIDVQRDPTSHNLWPFEVLFGLIVAMPGALMGAWFGGYLSRATAMPVIVGAAVTAVGVLTAALHVPLVFAERAAVESEAREELGALETAQKDFHAASGRGTYTCNLSKLTKAFDTPVRTHELSQPVKGIYETGTWARAGDYEFMLLCERNNRGDRFLLTAAPVPQALGRWAYCVESDGVIQQVERGQYNQKGCGL